MALERRYAANRAVQASDSNIFVQALPRAGILSGLGLRVEITNGATRGTERVFESIDRIEVIANGSEILYSLEGIEAYKWQYVIQKRRPAHIWTEVNAAVQELTFLIPFGRFIGDPDLALDLARYQLVELRVTFSPTISATTFATLTTTFSVIEYMWRPGSYSGTPSGFIRTTQVRSFTTAASGEEVFELPRRNRLLDALVHVREVGTNPDASISLLEVRENDSQLIPYTGRGLDILAENQEMLSLDTVENGIALVQDTDTFDTHQSRILGCSLDPVFVQSDANGIVTVNVGSITVDRVLISASETADAAATTHFTAYAARRQVHWLTRGFGLPQAFLIPLWDGNDWNSAYDAPSKQKVQLALTQADAGAACRASLRELVLG